MRAHFRPAVLAAPPRSTVSRNSWSTPPAVQLARSAPNMASQHTAVERRRMTVPPRSNPASQSPLSHSPRSGHATNRHPHSAASRCATSDCPDKCAQLVQVQPPSAQPWWSINCCHRTSIIFVVAELETIWTDDASWVALSLNADPDDDETHPDADYERGELLSAYTGVLDSEYPMDTDDSEWSTLRRSLSIHLKVANQLGLERLYV